MPSIRVDRGGRLALMEGNRFGRCQKLRTKVRRAICNLLIANRAKLVTLRERRLRALLSFLIFQR
jgi:hypothetical protein